MRFIPLTANFFQLISNNCPPPPSPRENKLLFSREGQLAMRIAKG